jgi:hypothetical protein
VFSALWSLKITLKEHKLIGHVNNIVEEWFIKLKAVYHLLLTWTVTLSHLYNCNRCCLHTTLINCKEGIL